MYQLDIKIDPAIVANEKVEQQFIFSRDMDICMPMWETKRIMTHLVAAIVPKQVPERPDGISCLNLVKILPLLNTEN